MTFDTTEYAESYGAVVVDFDGTLCDCLHRVPFAQQRDWDSFHNALSDDKVHEDVAMLIGNLAPEIKIIGLTGRNERYRQKTLDWLRKNDLDVFEEIIMRPDNDFMPDHLLKPLMLAEYFGDMETAKENVICILDDRDKVVSAFREIGFSVFHVRPERY